MGLYPGGFFLLGCSVLSAKGAAFMSAWGKYVFREVFDLKPTRRTLDVSQRMIW
jgi:hypothetical protein